jgi:rhomboid protease GluP
LTLIALNVAVYLAMVAKGISAIKPTPQDLLSWGADFGPLTLNGQWWRLLTSCFLHFGIIHIAMNMYVFFQVGVFTEMLYGKARFVILYILAGLGGNLVSLYIHPFTVSAGASGAIFGVYGALLAFLLVERGVLPKASAMQIGRSAVIFLGYNLIYGISDGTTDLSAHIGGLITGFIAGCVLLLLRPRFSNRTRLNASKIIAVVALTGVAGAAGLKLTHRSNHGNSEWFRQLMAGPSVPALNGGRVIYTGSATKADAESLAHGLDEAGYTAHPGAIALLSMGPGGPSISVPIGREESAYERINPLMSKTPEPTSPGGPVLPWNDPEVIAATKVTGVAVAPLIGGPPIKMLLMTDTGDVKRIITIDTRKLTIGTRDTILYSGSATEKDAQALGESLRFNGIFHDNGGRVMLAKGSTGTELSFSLADYSWENPRLQDGFQAIARKIAGSIGGLPITVHLLDSNSEPRSTFIVR